MKARLWWLSVLVVGIGPTAVNSTVCAAGICYAGVNASWTTQQTCPPYSNTNGTGATSLLDCRCTPGSFSTNGSALGCSQCAAGSFSLAGATACVACSAGSFSNATAASACVACALGNYCPSGSTQQQQCASGSYCTNASLQATCDSGFYCPIGSYAEIQCKTCDALATQTFVCSVGRSSDVSTCACIAGYYGTGYTGACASCLAGYWCSASQNISCPPNSNSPAMSSSQNKCQCVRGYFGDGFLPTTSPCNLCWAGYYCPGNSANYSLQCPTNSISPVGAGNITDCGCMPGFYGPNGTACQLCPVGSKCISGVITSCPQNSTSLTTFTGLDSCVCDPGFYGASGVCVMCQMNHYCPGGAYATPCNATSVTAGRGSFSPNQCFCDRGYVGTNNSACSQCPTNQWCWNGVANVCPDNTVAPALASYVANCSCVAGYSGPQGGPCYGCSYGTYNSGVGKSACDGCSPGTYGTGVGFIAPTNCSACAAGTYSNATAASSQAVCHNCETGTYNPNPSESACALCAPDNYALIEGSQQCILCPYGSGTNNTYGTKNMRGCLCLPTWNCTYTRRAFSNLIVNASNFQSAAELSHYIAGLIKTSGVLVFNY